MLKIFINKLLKCKLSLNSPLKQHQPFSLKHQPTPQRLSELRRFSWMLNILTGTMGVYIGYSIGSDVKRKNVALAPASTNTIPAITCPMKSHASLAPILANADPAVVCIRLIKNNSLVQEQSGFVVDGSGLTMTIGMDTSQFDQISIKTSDGRTFPASLVEYDTSSGLCMLKMYVQYPAYFHSLKLLSKGDQSIKTGDFVLTLGASDGNCQDKFSFGIIKSYQEDDHGIKQKFTLNTAIEGRFYAGGPVLNMHGKVIGVNQTISNTDSKSQIFIPIESGRSLLERIKEVHINGSMNDTKPPVYVSPLETKLTDHKKDCFFR